MKSTTRSHQGLALGLLLTLLASIYYLTVQPIIDSHHHYSEKIDQAKLQLGKLIRIANSQETIRDRLQEVKTKDVSGDYYLTGNTPGLAAATLQKNIKAIVESSQGQLVSIRDLPSSTETDLTKVSVAVRLKADNVSLQEILYALETTMPLIFVDKVSVSSRSYRSRRYGKTPTQSLLDIQLDLSGYARSSEATGSI